MEILVGLSAPLKHKVIYGGESIDPDGLVAVDIYYVEKDPIEQTLTHILQATFNALKIETDIGAYEVTLPYYLVDTQRQIEARWKYKINGQDIVKTQQVFVTQPYVDLIEVLEELELGWDYNDENNKTLNELQLAERYARKMIESQTGQHFNSYQDSYVMYGDNSDIMPSPMRVVELKEIYINDVLSYSTYTGQQMNALSVLPKISETKFGIKIDRGAYLDQTVYVANGLVPPMINEVGLGFFRKDTRYVIQAVFGWEHVPNNIQVACVELMKDYFSKDKVWRNKYIKNISTFDWQFEFNSSTFSGTGNNYVDQLLLPYTINKMVLI